MSSMLVLHSCNPLYSSIESFYNGKFIPPKNHLVLKPANARCTSTYIRELPFDDYLTAWFIFVPPFIWFVHVNNLNVMYIDCTIMFNFVSEICGKRVLCPTLSEKNTFSTFPRSCSQGKALWRPQMRRANHRSWKERPVVGASSVLKSRNEKMISVQTEFLHQRPWNVTKSWQKIYSNVTNKSSPINFLYTVLRINDFETSLCTKTISSTFWPFIDCKT